MVCKAAVDGTEVETSLMFLVPRASNQTLRKSTVKGSGWVENNVVLRVLSYIEIRYPCFNVQRIGKLRKSIAEISVNPSGGELAFWIQGLGNTRASTKVAAVLETCAECPLVTANLKASIQLIYTCINGAGG